MTDAGAVSEFQVFLQGLADRLVAVWPLLSPEDRAAVKELRGDLDALEDLLERYETDD